MTVLADLHGQIRAAVAALVEPVTVTLPREGGGWAYGVNSCLIDQLEAATANSIERRAGRRSGGAGLPICVAAVDLHTKARRTFQAPGMSLKQSIAEIPAYLPGNEDIAALSGGLSMLRRLKRDIENLFVPSTKLSLKGICPECGADSIARRDELGEHVRVPALVVDFSSGARCQNCEYVWDKSRFSELANTLTQDRAA